MRKLLLFFLLFLSFGFSFAQSKDSLSLKEQERRRQNIEAGNPFKKFGYTPKIATLSKGKYLEWHDLDSIVRIGSYSFHVKKKEIVGYDSSSNKNSETTLRPEIPSRWISPDPLAEEFPEWSPYTFVLNNPIRMIDPTGLAPDDVIIRGKNNSSITVVTDLIDINVDASSIVGDLGGNYSFGGDDILVAALDIVGIFDPTGVADAAAASIEFSNGNFWSGVASAAGIIPYIGDIGKTGKIPKHVKTIENAVSAVKSGDNAASTSRAARREVMRKEGIPTSQQPTSQSKNASGREYSYEVPKAGGGTQTKSVQQQTKDRSHQGQPHWEAGKVKTDNGKPRMNNYGRPKLENNKSKVDY